MATRVLITITALVLVLATVLSATSDGTLASAAMTSVVHTRTMDQACASAASCTDPRGEIPRKYEGKEKRTMLYKSAIVTRPYDESSTINVCSRKGTIESVDIERMPNIMNEGTRKVLICRIKADFYFGVMIMPYVVDINWNKGTSFYRLLEQFNVLPVEGVSDDLRELLVGRDVWAVFSWEKYGDVMKINIEQLLPRSGS